MCKTKLNFLVEIDALVVKSARSALGHHSLAHAPTRMDDFTCVDECRATTEVLGFSGTPNELLPYGASVTVSSRAMLV